MARLPGLMHAALAAALLLAAGDAAAGPVIAIVISAIGSGIASYFGMGGIAAIAFKAVFSIVLSGIFGKESEPSQDTGNSGGFTAEARGRQQIVRSNVATRALVYGEVYVSGPLVFAGTSGATNAVLDLVIVLAPHRVHSIGDVYLNDELLGDLDADGNVTTGRFAGLVKVSKHLGTQTEADAGLLSRHPSVWTASRVGYGVAYMVVTLTYDRDVFPLRIPTPKAVVCGALLHDPRTGQTAYSTNWALAVRDYLLRSRIEGGLGADADEVDDDDFVAAANVCDERVAMAAYQARGTASAATGLITYTEAESRLATGDEVTLTTDGTLPAPLLPATSYYVIRRGATTARLAVSYEAAIAGVGITLTSDGDGTLALAHQTQARYTVNGTLDTAKTPRANLESLMTGAAGVLTYCGGQFSAFPAAYEAPEDAITVDDLRDSYSILPAPTRRELFNAVRGTYADPSRYWQPGDFPAVRNPLYAAEDAGEEIFRDIELPFTDNEIRAQRLAKVILEKSRQGQTLTLPLKLTAATFRARVWRTVRFTDAGAGLDKTYRVVNWRLADDAAGVDLTVREDTAESYEWDAGEATITDPAPNTNLPNPFVVGVPSAPVVAESLYETTGSAGVKARADVSCSAAPDAFVLRYEFHYKADNDGDDAWVALPSVSLLSARLDDVTPGSYDFRVRAISTLGVRSEWSPTTTVELLGLADAPADMADLAVLASGGLGLASWTLTTDLDVRIGGRVWIRHAPVTSGATWSGGVVVGKFPGGAVQGFVPLVTGTYMAKFQDSSGRYSETEATFVASEGMVTGLSTLTTITESTGFAGSKTQCEVDTGTLILSSTGDADSPADVDALDDADAIGDLYSSGTYLFNTVYDGTTKAVRRYEADIAVDATDTASGPDDWADADAVANADGDTVNDCNAQLYAATTDDNPAGSPTWGAWTPFHVADFNCRAVKFKLELTSGAPTHQIAVSTLAVAVKA